MSDLTDLLGEIQDRADRATEGPWEAYSVPASRREAGYSAVGVSDTEVQVTQDVGGWLDADFIAHAREDVPRLVTALRAVLGAHTPIEVEPSETLCRECSFRLPSGRYFGKLTEWPCPTVREITEALEVAASPRSVSVLPTTHAILGQPGAVHVCTEDDIEQPPLSHGDLIATALHLIGEAWDDGNAAGLDGWVGPGRGSGDVDHEAERGRARMVHKAERTFEALGVES